MENKYKFLRFCCSWEIDSVDGSRIVCAGFLPYTEEDGIVFSAARNKAITATRDEDVIFYMRNWME